MFFTMATQNQSEICQFYKNKCVLVTGATGLIGKVIVWKLLTACKDIDKIFLLMRPLKGQSVNERLDDMLTRSRDLFKYQDAYKQSEKLVAVEGDVVKKGLGLSEKDKEVILKSVSVVIHSAADINFASKNLRQQILINVGGTLEVIDLCKQLKKLESFVHVSTAYCNPKVFVTEEKIYKAHVDPFEMLAIARDPNQQMTTEKYLGKFDMTYFFTKNLAENLIRSEWSSWTKSGNKLPTAIARPGICVPTFKEPVTGWIDSLNGLTGAGLMVAVGLARMGRFFLDGRLDLIGLDTVANSCIALGWSTAKKYANELRVYNINTCCLLVQPKLGQSLELMYQFNKQFPMLKTVRPVATPTSRFWMMPVVYDLTRFFSETCFAYICDLALMVIGEKKFVVKLMKRFHKITDIIEPLGNRQWYFTNNNFVGITYDQNPIDRQLFPCDVREIDSIGAFVWGYFTNRKVFLREKDEDVPRAQKQMRYIQTAYTIGHHLAAAVFWLFLIQMISWFFGPIHLVDLFMLVGLTFVLASTVFSLFQTWTFKYPKFADVPRIIDEMKLKMQADVEPAQFPQYDG